MSTRLVLLLGTLSLFPGIVVAQSESDFDTGTEARPPKNWDAEPRQPHLPPVERPAIDLARSRITTVWAEKPYELPSAQSLAMGIVSQPQSEEKDELDEEARRRREAAEGRKHATQPEDQQGHGWLTITDLYSLDQDDGSGAGSLNPDPAPEPGTLVVLGGPVAWALLRRRARGRVNPQGAGRDAFVGVPAEDRRRH